MSKPVAITEENGTLAVSSPYHPDFPSLAKQLGGRWDGARKVWTFDARDLERVAEICRDVYGTDGTDGEGELKTLRVTYKNTDYTYETACYVAGRQVARVYGRDSGASLGDGVVVLEGGFFSGGSRKSPMLHVKEGTVIEVRDVPAGAKLEADLDGVVEVVDQVVTDREALEAERAKLVARLAEIDELLAK